MKQSQVKQKLITAVDRTGMNLPETQECTACHEVKPHLAFRLKRSTHIHGPQLEPVCKDCSGKTKDVKKGIYRRMMKSGANLISDRLIEKLLENNGAKLDRVITALIDMATANNKTSSIAMNLLVGAVQGKPSHVKPVEPEIDDFDEDGQQLAESPADGSVCDKVTSVKSVDDLLKKLDEQS